MFPPKALDAKENGAVLGTTRILNGNAVILPFPEPEKTSMAICRVNFLLQGRAMSLKGGSLGAIGHPGISPWLRTNMDVKSQNTLLLRTIFSFQPDSNTHGRDRCSQQWDFPRQKVTDLSDWWLTLSWLFFKECSFSTSQFPAIWSFEKSRSDHFSQGIERIRTVWPSKTDGVETVKDHDQYWRCRI